MLYKLTILQVLHLGITAYKNLDAKVIKEKGTVEVNIGGGDSLKINSEICNNLILGNRNNLTRLSSGTYGTTYEYQGVVFKVLNTVIDEDRKDFLRELKVLNLKHVNIIQLYDMIFYKGKPIVVMEHGGQSVQTFYSTTPISDDDLWIFISSISNAIDYLHCQSCIVHCDLNANNIVKNNQGVFKLIDFGLCHKVDSKSQRGRIRSLVLGTTYFMAPELHKNGVTPDKKIDIWSFGMTILQVKDRPSLPRFTTMNELQFKLFMRKDGGIYDKFVEPNWTDQLKEVLRMCLTVDPNKRCNASELKKFVEKISAN